MIKFIMWARRLRCFFPGYVNHVETQLAVAIQLLRQEGFPHLTNEQVLNMVQEAHKKLRGQK